MRTMCPSFLWRLPVPHASASNRFEHVRQDSARREVRCFDRRIDPEYEGHRLAPAVSTFDVQLLGLARDRGQGACAGPPFLGLPADKLDPVLTWWMYPFSVRTDGRR